MFYSGVDTKNITLMDMEAEDNYQVRSLALARNGWGALTTARRRAQAIFTEGCIDVGGAEHCGVGTTHAPSSRATC